MEILQSQILLKDRFFVPAVPGVVYGVFVIALYDRPAATPPNKENLQNHP